MTKKLGWSIAGTCAVLALAWWLWPHPLGPRAEQDLDAAETLPPFTQAPRPAPPVAQGLAQDLSRPLAPSLQGTEVDGDVATGPGGHLIVSVGLRRLFDYFLAATGEVPQAAIEARIVAVIKDRVGDPAASEARDVLQRYLRWRQHASVLMETAGDGLQERLDTLKASRRQFFSASEAEALWGEEERATAAHMLQQAARDPNHSREQQARDLAAADAARPEATRRSEDAAMQVLTHRATEATLRAQGATAQELHAARVQSVGVAAAERLEALDARRAAWDARVQDYLKMRQSLVANPALSAAERDNAVDALRAQRFDHAEQLRVRTLEGDTSLSEAP